MEINWLSPYKTYLYLDRCLLLRAQRWPGWFSLGVLAECRRWTGATSHSDCLHSLSCGDQLRDTCAEPTAEKAVIRSATWSQRLPGLQPVPCYGTIFHLLTVRPFHSITFKPFYYMPFCVLNGRHCPKSQAAFVWAKKKVKFWAWRSFKKANEFPDMPTSSTKLLWIWTLNGPRLHILLGNVPSIYFCSKCKQICLSSRTSTDPSIFFFSSQSSRLF